MALTTMVTPRNQGDTEHDKRAPLKHRSEGPTCQVRLSNYRMVYR
jgi:hypothetical protein